MNSRTGGPGVTFSVQDVERGTEPLTTCKTHKALSSLLDRRPLEACCDYTSNCLRNVHFHPLLNAAHFAFSLHRPLTLSPDMIWVTIVQGLARHIQNHAERLRHRLVTHQGKLEICVVRTDLNRRSPENPWGGVVHDLTLGVQNHLGPRSVELTSDFSTTGPTERIACQVALLDAFQPYFEYRAYAACGIPEVTLEGTPGDWRRLRDKVEALAPYDLDWWLPHLRDICGQFVRASSGDIDLTHWRNIYKRMQVYGSDNINGWLVKLIPYLKQWYTGNFTVSNPLLSDPDARVSTNELPTGVSQVPFRCRWRGRDEDEAMELLGGFIGVTQDTSTLALRPKLGWAVRNGSDLDRLFARLSRFEPSSPLAGPVFDGYIVGFSEQMRCELPGDFLSFYKHCNGVSLFQEAFRFRPLEEVKLVEGITTPQPEDYNTRFGKWDVGPWARFCDLADGCFVALELQEVYKKGWKVVRVDSASGKASPILTWSFREFLSLALDSKGRLETLRERL